MFCAPIFSNASSRLFEENAFAAAGVLASAVDSAGAPALESSAPKARAPGSTAMPAACLPAGCLPACLPVCLSASGPSVSQPKINGRHMDL